MGSDVPAWVSADVVALDEPEPWDFGKQETTPDIVVINLGTNDHSKTNNVSSKSYVNAYIRLIQGVHGKYPKAQVIVMVRSLSYPPRHPSGSERRRKRKEEPRSPYKERR